MSTLRQMAKTAQVAAAAPTPRSSAKLTRKGYRGGRVDMTTLGPFHPLCKN